MRKSSMNNSKIESCPIYKRTGFASFLFAIICPKDAKAALLSPNVLRLAFTMRLKEIPVGRIEASDVKTLWRWGSVRIRYASGKATISGLSRHNVEELAKTLEATRVDWWRRLFATQIRSLRSVHDRLVHFSNPPRYISYSSGRDLERDAEVVASLFASRWPDALSNSPEIKMLKTVQEYLKDPDGCRTKANEIYVANQLNDSHEFFDQVEARPLTDEQRKAVVIDEDRNLVVAAAGSGKTSVIVAKAGWLTWRGYRRPSELLLLAFARDAQKELEERLQHRLGDETAQDLTVRTFHSLGMSIIGQAEGERPTLARVAEDSRALSDLLKAIVDDLRTERTFAGILLKWFQTHFAPYRSEHEFQSMGEYWDYVRQHDIRSLKGDKVKSYQECVIANFLYLNGIPYEYEAIYEHKTATPERRQYQPDFYLPEAGIYIEHFGLNTSGDPAPFINKKEYLQGMEWKRSCHVKYGTTLIETFSHEHDAGKLTDYLAKKLAVHGVTLSPIPSADVFSVLNEQGRIDPFTRFVATFLQHYKGARLSFREVARRATGVRDRLRAEAFLAVFKPIFQCYQDTLSQQGQIDFHDMINKATEHVETGRYRSPFGYILVDEFQDISPGRAKLLKALLDQSPTTQLFAVGDDWQSIYRFGGSDIAVMREFETHFGHSERIDLGTTFRCADRISEVATDFILRNPTQICKEVHSRLQATGTSVFVGLPEKEHSLLREALDEIAADATCHDGGSTVLLLSRYRHMQPENMSELDRQYPGLQLSFMTVHRSKGLEADYVVVLGLCSGKYGFPSEISDDPLLDLVLAEPEKHPNAEERRLFYVAITRARRRVYLLADDGPPSPFVQELIDGEYDVAVFGRVPENDIPCPRCAEGRLERRENAQNEGVFYGCSNWPYCKYRQPACPSCGTGLLAKEDDAFRCNDCGQPAKSCPSCDGWLRKRVSKYGPFLGCSNWPSCDYTRNIAHPRSQN